MPTSALADARAATASGGYLIACTSAEACFPMTLGYGVQFSSTCATGTNHRIIEQNGRSGQECLVVNADDPLGTGYPWYAVHVRSSYEKRAADALMGKGYECLWPSYRERRNWSDRTKIVELPIFPGYVFSRFDVEVRLPILTTPGVIGVAGVGRIPAPLDEHEIDQVRAITQVGYPAQPWPYLRAGQKVRIIAGALTGVEGILQNWRGETRVVLSLTHLQQSMSVITESDAIRPLP